MIRKIRSFLFSSTPASFESQYGLHESVERLRAATKRTVFGAIAAEAAVGSVSEKRVTLQRAIPLVGNSFKPFFIGRFEQSERGWALVGRFSMHWMVKVFMTFWFGFCLFWIVMAIAANFLRPSANWSFPLFGLGMVFAGTTIVLVGKWFARNDIAWLSNVINSALSVPSVG